MQSFSSNLPSLPAALQNAIQSSHLELHDRNPLAGDIIHWQASERQTGLLDENQGDQLSRSIQMGGCLLLTFDTFPGTSPLRLGGILPTTAWSSQVRKSSLTPKEPMNILHTDRSFFENGLDDLAVSINCDIRPAPAVERGQARYERYGFTHPWLHTSIEANSDFWSRSLLNRGWKVRAQADDLARMPLVVTGQYGAGKVVVVANSAAGIGDSELASGFWRSILRWLMSATPKPSSLMTKPFSQASIIDGHVELMLENRGGESLPVQVVLRVLTSDGAPLPDLSGEQQRLFSLPPEGRSALRLPLITRSPHSWTQLDASEQFKVRAGVLSADGSLLLSEHRLLTPPAPVTIRIETDNLYSIPYPFHAPGPNALQSFIGRMGAYVGAYAYAPGQSVKGTIVLMNGIENLAPLSIVKDLSAPENKSVMALNDNATGQRLGPSPDKIDAYSMWTGKPGVENSIEFTLPKDSQITGVVIVTTNGGYGNGSIHWPGQVVIEADGHEVARIAELDELFVSGFGQARIDLQRCPAKSLVVRLPWMSQKKGTPRQEPWLGEIRVEGWRGQGPSKLAEDLILILEDALDGKRTKVLESSIQVSGYEEKRVSFELPLPNVEGIRFLRLEASVGQLKASAPILVISPKRSLLPMTDLFPREIAGVGMNVSNGFRQVFQIGTGTQEAVPGWSTPDDLIWSYSRQLKTVHKKLHSSAMRLYLNDSDMRHYVTPWCSFSSGELFLQVAAPLIVKNLKLTPRWKKSEIVQLTFADGWDCGPNLDGLNGWQDYVQFDQFLRKDRGRGLQGKTHQELSDEIGTICQDEWQAWQLDRFVRGVDALRTAFSAEGKTLLIYCQGVPMVAGAPGQNLSRTFCGMHDDCTWSMLDESVALTTGREISNLAFNPVWKMSTLNPWGFNSPIYNNWQWHNPVGTTEPSRRHLYNRAWRGTCWPEKGYGGLHTYGYTSNVGIAYTMTERDFQHWWRMQELQSLISPESPIGAGLVISTAKSADPHHIRFTCGDSLTLDEPRLLAQSFRNLNDAALSLPFAVNAGALENLNSDASLILLNPQDFSLAEIEFLKSLLQRGTRLAAFAERASLPSATAALFQDERNLLIEASASSLTHADALRAVQNLRQALDIPIQFPAGTTGYGFRSLAISFIVVEDWLEMERRIEVVVTKSHGAVGAHACNVNEHRPLVIRGNEGTWVIELPLLSGDGVLIALKEDFHES